MYNVLAASRTQHRSFSGFTLDVSPTRGTARSPAHSPTTPFGEAGRVGDGKSASRRSSSGRRVIQAALEDPVAELDECRQC